MRTIHQSREARTQPRRAPAAARRITRAVLAALVGTAAAVTGAPAIIHAPGAQSHVTTQTTTPPAPVRSGHIMANGVNYYYQVHGQGEPVLLLHGWGRSKCSGRCCGCWRRGGR